MPYPGERGQDWVAIELDTTAPSISFGEPVYSGGNFTVTFTASADTASVTALLNGQPLTVQGNTITGPASDGGVVYVTVVDDVANQATATFVVEKVGPGPDPEPYPTEPLEPAVSFKRRLVGNEDRFDGEFRAYISREDRARGTFLAVKSNVERSSADFAVVRNRSDRVAGEFATSVEFMLARQEDEDFLLIFT